MPKTAFDDPDGTLAMLRDSVAGLAGQHPGPGGMRMRRAAGLDLDRSLWVTMAEAGWTGLLLPESLGGSGLGLTEQAVLSEALGRHLISEPLAATAVVASVLLSRAPASPERDRLARGMADGSLIVAPAWRDPSPHARGAKLRASEADGGLLLDGDRHFVDAAQSATDFLVIAETDSGAVLVSVPGKAPGLSVSVRASVDGAQIGALTLAHVQCPTSAVVARAASVSELLEAPIQAARLAIAAELAGVGSKALELTIEYTKQRVQFGKPIASFQAIQHRLVDMWSDAEFACAAVVNAAERCAQGDATAARLAVLAAKARAGDAAVSICRRAVHLHGAMGFTDECDIGLYLKRAISLSACLGQPEAMRLEFVQMERAA